MVVYLVNHSEVITVNIIRHLLRCITYARHHSKIRVVGVLPLGSCLACEGAFIFRCAACFFDDYLAYGSARVQGQG
jgi:hypothetical protein